MTTRALSLWQPYATAIAVGAKRYLPKRSQIPHEKGGPA